MNLSLAEGSDRWWKAVGGEGGKTTAGGRVASFNRFIRHMDRGPDLSTPHGGFRRRPIKHQRPTLSQPQSSLPKILGNSSDLASYLPSYRSTETFIVAAQRTHEAVYPLIPHL